MDESDDVSNQSSSTLAGLLNRRVSFSLLAVVVSFVILVISACSRSADAKLVLVVSLCLVPIANLFLAVNISDASTNSNVGRWGMGVGVFLALLTIQWFGGFVLVYVFGPGLF